MESNHTPIITEAADVLGRLTHSREYRGYIDAREAFDLYLRAFVVVNREELSRIHPLSEAMDDDDMVTSLYEAIDTGMVRPQ